MIFQLIYLIFVLVFYHYWINWNFYKAAKQFRQTFALPLVGNTYHFVCKDEDILGKIGDFLREGKGDYHMPKVFWLGRRLGLFFTDPKSIEEILLSRKFVHKSIFYEFIKFHLGEGLVTASGPQYKKHRRVIAPLFDPNFNDKCYDIFEKYLDLHMNELKEYCDKDTFDVHKVIRRLILSFISSIILGIDYNFEKYHDFTEASEEVYRLSFHRLVRPWYHLDLTYKMTSIYKAEEVARLNSIAFIRKAIEKSRQRIITQKEPENGIEPIIDQLGRILEEKPDLMDAKVFHDHIYTLVLASEDTLSMSTSFCCVMLGMYPECQNKVAEELRNYFGTVPRIATLEDVTHLPYLDMCIKETLRIQPVAPMVTRKTVEDCTIGSWTIPKHTEIFLPTFFIHRDPEFWENPNQFYPDHFLPEISRKRPAYAYIPFSGGLRGCVGRALANAYLRIFLASFLQKYEVEADGKLSDIKFRMDISTRPVHGYNVRIKERIWK